MDRRLVTQLAVTVARPIYKQVIVIVPILTEGGGRGEHQRVRLSHAVDRREWFGVEHNSYVAERRLATRAVQRGVVHHRLRRGGSR